MSVYRGLRLHRFGLRSELSAVTNVAFQRARSALSSGNFLESFPRDISNVHPTTGSPRGLLTSCMQAAHQRSQGKDIYCFSAS
eukprot:4365214-Pyramimonas_sp.AAC.1